MSSSLKQSARLDRYTVFACYLGGHKELHCTVEDVSFERAALRAVIDGLLPLDFDVDDDDDIEPVFWGTAVFRARQAADSEESFEGPSIDPESALRIPEVIESSDSKVVLGGGRSADETLDSVDWEYNRE